MQVSEFLQNYAPSGDNQNCNQRCARSWITHTHTHTCTFAQAVQ